LFEGLVIQNIQNDIEGLGIGSIGGGCGFNNRRNKKQQQKAFNPEKVVKSGTRCGAEQVVGVSKYPYLQFLHIERVQACTAIIARHDDIEA
jgi:hypothetical protein